MFAAVRIAPAPLSLLMVSVPAVKVLPALAVDAVKSAPEAPVTPTATRTVARAARLRRGFALRLLKRDIEGSSWGECR